MDKRNEFRFSIQLDEMDESHRKVAAYLNKLGRKKGRVIAKALIAYMETDQGRTETPYNMKNPETQERTMAVGQNESMKVMSLDMNGFSFDQAEIDLMRRNYAKLGNGN